MKKRIGIFTGTFDPVHAGHVELVQRSIRQERLDEVIVVPESSPRGKRSVTELSHRKAMLVHAFASTENVRVTTISEPFMTFDSMIQLCGANDCYIILGSDVLKSVDTWNGVDNWLNTVGLIVGVRSGAEVDEMLKTGHQLKAQPREFNVISTDFADASSSFVRSSRQPLIREIKDYVLAHQLYRESQSSSPLL